MTKVDSNIDNGSKSGGKKIKTTVKAGETPIAGQGAPKPDTSVTGEGLMSKTIEADPRKEYVASGGYLWLNHYLRSLPWYIDDIQRDFGNDIYERMLFDPAVWAAFQTLKSAILREGIQILPVEDLKDPAAPATASLTGKAPRQSSPIAHEIAEFCRRNIAGMARMRSLDSLCYEILDGAAFGNKVGEMILDDAMVDPATGRIVQMLKTIKTKPRTSTAFVVDAYANVVGLLGLIPGQGYPVIVQGLMGKPGDVPNMLPREKFCIFVWQPTNEDPRGNSCLRSAYTPWWFKQQNLGERLKFSVRLATASLAGFTAPDALPVPQVDAAGNPVIGVDGNPVVVSAQQNMQNALLGLQNGTVGAFPHGAEIEMLESKSEGQVFKIIGDDCDRDINKAILLQTLASGEAQHQARASSETHQDILELPIQYGKKALANMIAWDICRFIITQNYGEEYLAYCPIVALGDIESHNFAEMAKPLASLGYSLDVSQFEGIDRELGMPERAQGWQERQQAATDAANMAKMADTKKGGKDDDTD
jgi:hypothetical protein